MLTARFVAIGLLAAASAQATAAVVNLNASTAGYTFDGDVVDARYRMSNTNWDHMISTSSNVSQATIASSGNIGNNASLNGVTWDFNLSFAPAGGWTFSLTNGQTVHTRTWNSTFNGLSPSRSFNALEIFVVAVNPNASVYQSVTARATNMAFVSGSATTTGGLIDLVSESAGLARQHVISDTDMSTFAWSLQGKVQLAYVLKPGQSAGNLDERLKFDIKAENAVPTPGALALVAGAGLIAGRRRR